MQDNTLNDLHHKEDKDKREELDGNLLGNLVGS
jgi:hypothetical protein